MPEKIIPRAEARRLLMAPSEESVAEAIARAIEYGRRAGAVTERRATTLRLREYQARLGAEFIYADEQSAEETLALVKARHVDELLKVLKGKETP
jgi:hypothetical protein